METNLTNDARLALGEQLYEEACRHFKAFCDEKEVVTGFEEISALLLSLGVDTEDIPETLTL